MEFIALLLFVFILLLAYVKSEKSKDLNFKKLKSQEFKSEFKSEKKIEKNLKDIKVSKPETEESKEKIKLYTGSKIQTKFELDRFRRLKRDYLKSEDWNTKRKQTLFRDNYTCQSCGINGVSLDVHHMFGYMKIPNEPLESLVSVCRDCHNDIHKVLGFPDELEKYAIADYSLFTYKQKK